MCVGPAQRDVAGRRSGWAASFRGRAGRCSAEKWSRAGWPTGPDAIPRLPSLGMREWSDVALRIAATTRTSEKVATLAAYLRSLTPAALRIAVTYLTGRPFPERDARVTGIGWAAIAGVAESVAGAPPGCTGCRVQPVIRPGTGGRRPVRASVVTIPAAPRSRSRTSTRQCRRSRQRAEARAKASCCATCSSVAMRRRPSAVVKVISGDLRIGLREGHLEAAIAAAFDQPLADVQWAGMLTGDIGHTAELARDDRLDDAELTLFRPLKSMLASPVADEEEVLRRLGTPVWVEDKYDGIRAQLHKQGSEVRLFSRDLNDVSNSYPEVTAAASRPAWDGILDGELLAYRDGMALPFLQLQARLGRKNPSVEMQRQVPVIYVAFDLLALRRRPAGAIEPAAAPAAARATGSTRRPAICRRCRAWRRPTCCQPRPPLTLASIFDAAQERGNEGLMVKDPESIYTPGRRGYGWLKLKRPLATLDCVVVGVEVGHGKRHGVLSDYTFAVRDDRAGAEGRLVTIGKAYSGLTDAEIAEMTAWFQEHTLRRLGPFPRGRADRRGRDRLRRHPPLEAPRLRLRAALSAHLPAANGQGSHARSTRSPTSRRCTAAWSPGGASACRRPPVRPHPPPDDRRREGQPPARVAAGDRRGHLPGHRRAGSAACRNGRRDARCRGLGAQRGPCVGGQAGGRPPAGGRGTRRDRGAARREPRPDHPDPRAEGCPGAGARQRREWRPRGRPHLSSGGDVDRGRAPQRRRGRPGL